MRDDNMMSVQTNATEASLACARSYRSALWLDLKSQHAAAHPSTFHPIAMMLDKLHALRHPAQTSDKLRA